MNTKLLFITVCFGTILSATAQTTSFETSEGFALGLLNGQQQWTVGGAASPASSVSIVADNNASVGDNALKIIVDNAANPIITIDSPNYALTDSEVTVSYDVFIEGLVASGIEVDIRDSGSQSVSRVSFYNSGNIEVLSRDGTDNYVNVTIGTYALRTWINLRVDIDSSTNTVKYYINEQLLFSGRVIDATVVNRLNFTSYHTGNTGTSNYRIDNIQVVPTDTLGVKETELASQFSIYPNPAIDLINVSNKNAKITSVTLTDLNGRTVKQLSYDSLANVTVNIADLSAGMYLMNIKSSEGNATKKIVKN